MYKAIWNVPVSGSDGLQGDMAGSVKSQPYVFAGKNGSLEVVWTGTPTGTITIYASDSWDPTNTVDRWNGTWNSINSLLSPAPTAPAGAGGSYLISLSGFNFRAYYVDYARTGGTGVITSTYEREF